MTAERDSRYIKSPDPGIWLPPITPQQARIFNNFSRHLLICGTRDSTKTVGGVHKIMRHCYDCDGAMVAMVAKSVKTAKASGTWVDLTKIALPHWLNSPLGMRLIEGPKVDGATRMTFFRVTNRYGGESEVQLHSVEHDKEVEEKFKNTRYSMFYFVEADLFKDRLVFDTTTTQLRSFSVPYEHLQWIADSNPAEEGPHHWLYKLFIEFKDRPDRNAPDFDEEFHKTIDRIEFNIDDNPFKTEREKRILRATYRGNKNRYARYIEGKWEVDAEGTHFEGVFNPNIHVLGDLRQKEALVPTSACRTLLVGLDLGDVNHSAHIVEKIEAQENESAPIITQFAAIDELVVIKTKETIRGFTEALMELVVKWETYCKKNYGVQITWRCWSDNSAMRWKAAAEAMEELIVREFSQGKLIPQAAPKFNHSVRSRVHLVQQLLHEERLFISAQLFKTIEMFRLLKRGTGTQYIDEESPHKHPFDSLSYILHSEVPIDLLNFSQLKTDKAPMRVVST